MKPYVKNHGVGCATTTCSDGGILLRAPGFFELDQFSVLVDERLIKKLHVEWVLLIFHERNNAMRREHVKRFKT